MNASCFDGEHHSGGKRRRIKEWQVRDCSCILVPYDIFFGNTNCTIFMKTRETPNQSICSPIFFLVNYFELGEIATL